MEDDIWGKLYAIVLLTITYLFILTSVSIGLIGHFFHWLIFDVFGSNKKQPNRKLQRTATYNENEYYSIIIGSGFSGLGMAIKLRELGTDNFIIIERLAHLGGTWYANKYPGCACDVPSNLYSFSFEPNPKWSYFFGRQPEIGEYLEHCADKYDIRRHIKFNTTVSKLEWLEDKKLWEVTTESNHQKKKFYAQFVLAGYGPLSNPSIPTDIPGIDKFQGEMCHTAEWNKSLDFKNKRVAVVGTGASAIQAIPEIQKSGVEQLLIFQRTPPWVIPRFDRVVTKWEKKLFAKFPIFQKIIRLFMYWIRESTALSFVYRWPIRYVFEQVTLYDISRQVKDKDLRKKLTPKYDLGCKRVLLSNDWYPTVQKPNVKLVTTGIQKVTSNSIATKDGQDYPVDIIIWSTGFHVQEFSLPIFGIGGRSLEQQWGGSFQAYRGITVPNFPNLCFLLGPNTGLGHNSILVMIEAQIEYIAEALLFMDANNVRAIDVKENVYEEFNRNIQNGLKATVWQAGGCRSWYQDAKGNNTAIWPDFTWTYMLLMKNFDSKSYNLQD